MTPCQPDSPWIFLHFFLQKNTRGCWFMEATGSFSWVVPFQWAASKCIDFVNFLQKIYFDIMCCGFMCLFCLVLLSDRNWIFEANIKV